MKFKGVYEEYVIGSKYKSVINPHFNVERKIGTKKFNRLIRSLLNPIPCELYGSRVREDLFVEMSSIISRRGDTMSKIQRNNYIVKMKFMIKYGRYYNPVFFDIPREDFYIEGFNNYVYSYVNRKTGKTKYIGEGTDGKGAPFKRALQVLQHAHCKGCVKHHDKIDIHLLKAFKTKEEAVSYEQEMIDHYGIDNLWNGRR